MYGSLKYLLKETADSNIESKKILSNRNKKLGKILNLSFPTVVCKIKSETCMHCYARKVEDRFGNASKKWIRNLYFYLKDRDKFFEKLKIEINEYAKQNNETVLRLFASGDFPDVHFAEKIYDLALEFKNIKIFGYTRMWIIDEYLNKIKDLNKLDNVTLFCSVDRSLLYNLYKLENSEVRLPTCYVILDKNDNEYSKFDFDLIFRNYNSRKTVNTYLNGKTKKILICPMENGVNVCKDCLNCKFCFKTIKKRGKRNDDSGKQKAWSDMFS